MVILSEQISNHHAPICYSWCMTYIALLRGINVGGNKKVSMLQLKGMFESLGCESVHTYINSGNVVFTDSRKPAELHRAIESALAETFGFVVQVLLLNKPALDRIVSALPLSWRNDDNMRCDVMFLWKDKNSPDVVQEIVIKADVDHVKYVDGALLWCVARDQVTKSGLSRLIGTSLYKKITIRNCNTVRKLAELASQQ